MTNSIEERFVRDSRSFNEAISRIDQNFQQIWSTADATRMANLAKRLIDAMRIAVDLRINKIGDFIVGENSDFI